MTRIILTLAAAVALSACAVPLTGDQAQDCLNARNQVIQAQQVLTGANTALAVAIGINKPQPVIDALTAGVTVAQTNLATTQAMAADLCTPPVTIIPAI